MHSYVRVKQTHFKTQNFLKKLFHFPPVLYLGQSIVQTFTQTTMELGRTHLINPFGRRQAVFKNLFTNLEKRGNKESWTTCSTTFSVTPLETRLWYLSSLLKKRTVFFLHTTNFEAWFPSNGRTPGSQVSLFSERVFIGPLTEQAGAKAVAIVARFLSSVMHS